MFLETAEVNESRSADDLTHSLKLI